MYKKCNCQSMESKMVWLSMFFRNILLCSAGKKERNGTTWEWGDIFGCTIPFLRKKYILLIWTQLKDDRILTFLYTFTFKSDLLWSGCTFAYVKNLHWYLTKPLSLFSQSIKTISCLCALRHTHLNQIRDTRDVVFYNTITCS